MRLTLRNLLAFHHKMMSPSDQAAFQQLLDAAPRAKQLLNRCVELTRRSQLAAPALEQANEKHIADTVSKYLDFELPTISWRPSSGRRWNRTNNWPRLSIAIISGRCGWR